MIYANDRLSAESKAVLSGFRVVEPPADDSSLAECEVLITWPHRFDADLFRRMPRLRAIQTLSAGVDWLNFSVIPAEVKVFSNVGGYDWPVSEHVWGLIIGMAKGVNVRKQETRTRPIRGRTLLVLGAGSIGAEVARIGRAGFSMRTIGISRSVKSPELYDETHTLDDLKGVIGHADVVADLLPLTNLTRGVLDYETLKLLKRDSIIVNAGRGETIVEEAMNRLLRERPDVRYGTDVFWRREGRENFDSPLWELPNFGGTLHTGGDGFTESLSVAQVSAAENVRRFLTSGSARNMVNREDYAVSA